MSHYCIANIILQSFHNLEFNYFNTFVLSPFFALHKCSVKWLSIFRKKVNIPRHYKSTYQGFIINITHNLTKINTEKIDKRHVKVTQRIMGAKDAPSIMET